MNAEFINVLLVPAYLLFGIVGIVLLMGWALKHFGSAKRGTAKKPEDKPSAENQRQH